ncbi:adenosylcobinamide-GDP ribazoletransferase [Cellvibrio japonicus]|uniref:Adenosylcobinamide-GDP ribazoletransferase n=1 Tax=Cellvibrio japonicus (strain Ueda107) TaxID=498211 RepID=B3PC83_CELJU|nr:adenosylcobinamide-GDP ribazoletransferase [Cellvibrio japonicus]ACE86006.1 cobalamin 5'-phosphate synthase [Cellvibrio japonicus Ueda107]QEI13220.1 adenosylcobinamide-GDP ribazoletransferase [Cellvibrio japonicus]QEI16794.1 adenosylcobinamide-GDP ribazoletransferase [Cellvibrio japonicus]QEI20372.1 adenosylcobinamide-GDP ribazoletransferase [Cellvibrio japonicus]
MKQQLHLFLLALGFFSRIPIPAQVEYSAENLNRASRYFALVGGLLGALVALVFWAAQHLFPETVSLWLAMVFSLLLTGTFHEDGLADTADGFGGAFERDKKLLIMKDSRIGSYGACALVMALLGKYLLLIENTDIITALLIAYPLSRAVSGSLIFSMVYVADTDTSKSKPLANNQSRTDLFILLLGILPFFVLLPLVQTLILLGLLILLRQLAITYLARQIGGYTGDTLGAVQQVAELGIYGALLTFL